MSTVAFRSGVLAADRQATSGGVVTKCTKLFRVSGYAIGVAGTLSSGTSFSRWFAGDQTGEIPLDQDSCALVMDLETGDCHLWESTGVVKIEEEFEAIGSGSGIAYGALEMGADARQAVKIASKRDAYTGGGVQVMRAK